MKIRGTDRQTGPTSVIAKTSYRTTPGHAAPFERVPAARSHVRVFKEPETDRLPRITFRLCLCLLISGLYPGLHIQDSSSQGCPEGPLAREGERHRQITLFISQVYELCVPAKGQHFCNLTTAYTSVEAMGNSKPGIPLLV